MNHDPGRELTGQQFRDFCVLAASRVCLGVGIFPAVHTQYVSRFSRRLVWSQYPQIQDSEIGVALDNRIVNHQI